jgi:hypothetical protein
METAFMERRLCSRDGNNLSISDHDLTENDQGWSGRARGPAEVYKPMLSSSLACLSGVNHRKCLSWVAVLSRNCKIRGQVNFGDIPED